MLDFNKTTLLYGLFNEFVFPEAKMNIEYLKEYYRNDQFTKDNTLIGKLIYVIEKYKFIDITEATFISILEEDGKSVEEVQSILSKIKEYKFYTKEQATVFRANLKRLCYKAYADRVKREAGEDIVGYVDKLKGFEYRSNHSDTLSVKTFNDIDITDLVSRYSAEGYKSRYEFINKSFSCGGYIPGQIVTVVGNSGTGKSLFLQGEAVNFVEQGKRCHYIALGDLNELDLVNRIICMVAQKPQYEIESDIRNYFEMYRHKVGDLFGMTVVPAGVINPTDYIEWMLNRIDEYDVLFVDYDANFSQNPDLSMYDQYGVIYNLFTQLTRTGKLLFVACQPKQAYVKEDVLPQEAAGESSRKIQISDVIITISENRDSGMPMGKLNIAKSRRGKKAIQPYIRTNEGLFYPCSEALYAKYCTDKRKDRWYSYKEWEGEDILNGITNSSDSEYPF